MSYYSLHCHSEFSNLRMLDSTNKLIGLVDRAMELGLRGIALTDHETVSGWVRAIEQQKIIEEQGYDFRIFLGDEIYLVDSLEEVRDNYIPKETKFFHFILIAKDEIGGKQIRKISSQAWMNSFHTGKMLRVPIDKQQLEDIIGEDKGHIIAQTACIGGELAYWILNDQPDKCLNFIDWCQETFLPENFYLEMQPNDCEEQVKVNQTIIKISEQLDIPFIITTDAHYLSADQKEVHSAYLNSRSDESRETEDFYRTCYLMTAEEIHLWMDKQIGIDNVDVALKNTYEIADKIEFFDLFCSTIVPDTNVPEFQIGHLFQEWYDKCPYIRKFAYSDDDYDRYLLYLIEEGFKNKVSKDADIDSLVERIEIELSEMWMVTEKLGTSISAYYLTTLDLVNTMWDEGDSLVGVARGSVTGMYTMYLIGITQLNPLLYDLKHWRHISHTKVELSDVDLDSQRNRRGQILQAIKDKRGDNKVLNCCTFKTEGSKSAIITSCRGMGIDNDEAQYIASLIPVTRGFTWTIKDCLYGNKEDDREPVANFIKECQKFDGLIEMAEMIEGMICGRSIHASAVYLFNSDYNDHNALMKAPNGLPVTQFNMKDSDYCSGLKEDLLTIKSLDSIRKCLDYLVEYGEIEWQGSLRETYNKYLHPDVLDYTTPEMWDMVGRGEITDLFQFDTEVGRVAINKIKPRSLIELATASSVMRLMEKGGEEQPIETYVRYKNDISQWYDCMRNDYRLTDNEIKILEKYLLKFHGIGATQEDVMLISMDENISHFDVKNSNILRKGISKKNKKIQQAMKEKFYKDGIENGASENLLNYVWEQVVGKQLGYSFSINHTTPYACIALQEMNLAYHYPIVYWNTACLSINAAADEESENNKSTQYGKVGVAIAKALKEGINIKPPYINEAKFGFTPIAEDNSIIYALKAMNGIGDEVSQAIIENRPYTSMEDFAERMLDTNLIKNSQMIKLIKGGCFDTLYSSDRFKTMEWYLRKYQYDPIGKLTLSQLGRAKEFGIIPAELDFCLKCIEFKKYVLDDEGLYEKWIDPAKSRIPKKGYHDGHYILDEYTQQFFKENFTEDSIVDVVDGYYVVSEKLFTKEIDSYIQPLKNWFMTFEAETSYNKAVWNEIWNRHASGTEASWSMEALCYYDGKHELADVDEKEYGIVNYFDLPVDPEPYEYYRRKIDNEWKVVPKYNISRIAGTVLNTDNSRHTIALLTCYGVVNIKMYKESYAFYNKRISQIQSDGKKKVLEDSWLKRGNKLLISGIRRDDQFFPLVYSDTIYKHTICLIKDINQNGKLLLQTERIKV